VDDELAAGGGGVDLLGERSKADTARSKGCDDFNEVLQRATQPIEPLDDQGVPCP
jgi:hypothetical protein